MVPPAPGGCSFDEDPCRPAATARLFWRSDCNPRVLRARACATSSDDPQRFELMAQRTPAWVLVRGDAVEELLLGQRPTSVQLSILSGTLLAGPVRLAFDIPGREALELRISSLRRFAALQSREPLSAALSLAARGRRQELILRSLDASATGASLREIAIALFGPERVNSDWNHPSDYLKSRVRRLVREARRLLAGGYRDLLST